MKGLLLCMVGAVVLIAVVSGALLVRERNALQAEVIELKAQLAAAGTKVTLGSEGSAKATTTQPSTAGITSNTPISASDPGKPPTKVITPSTGANAMSKMVEMMKTPAMREMMKQQQIAQLDMQYGGLVERFNLTEEERANFRTLLAERVTADADLSMKMMDTSLSKADRDAATAQHKADRAASDERLKTFLNSDEDYNTFKHWDSTKAERMQLNMGKGLFAKEPLTIEQEERIIQATREAQSRPKRVPSLNRPDLSPSTFTAEDIERQIAAMREDEAIVLGKTQQFLSPAQIEAFKEWQKQWRTMAEAGLQMSRSMFGKDK